MSWPAWISVSITLILSLISLVRSYAEDRGASRVWKNMIEDTLKRHEDELKKHSQHATDPDRHFTPRERDELAKQLDRIEELIRESMTERARHANGNTERPQGERQ